MPVTSKPYTGVRQTRYEFLLEHDPGEVRRMEEAGELDDYLWEEGVRFTQRCCDLYRPCLERLGGSEALKASDFGRWLQVSEQAREMARETAMREVILAP